MALSRNGFNSLRWATLLLFLWLTITGGKTAKPVRSSELDDLRNLHLLCNPCRADKVALKLSEYLRLLNSKRGLFLEDERRKFAEEAPWYLGKRSGEAAPRMFADSYAWRVGKRDDADPTPVYDRELYLEAPYWIQNAPFSGGYPARRTGADASYKWELRPPSKRFSQRSRWSPLMHQVW